MGAANATTTRVIEATTVLRWGHGRDCTFVGALESALAATDHPFTYVDLMGWSALAFRTRWWRWDGGEPTWCNSASVGEFPEETQRVEQATGWRFKHGAHWKDEQRAQFTGEIVESLDAGKPVVGYGKCLDVAVAYGYEAGGKQFVWRDYDQAETPLKLDAEKIGPWWMILDRWEGAVSRRDALLIGLRAAVANWKREHDDAGIHHRSYWYGRAALTAWARDLGLEDAKLDEKQRERLFGASRFNWLTMFDARKAAAAFLRSNADALEANRNLLIDAAKAFEDEVALMSASPPSRWYKSGFARWSPDGRAEQKSLLEQAVHLEAKAYQSIEAALTA